MLGRLNKCSSRRIAARIALAIDIVPLNGVFLHIKSDPSFGFPEILKLMLDN